MEITCPKCRTVHEYDVAAVRAGKNLTCETCGFIMNTEDVMPGVDKALDDLKKSFPKKFDINIKF
jgi:hypothetical protein